MANEEVPPLGAARIYLETDRMLLRRFTATDAEKLYGLHNDPDVMRFINGGKPVSLAEIETQTLPRIPELLRAMGRLWFLGRYRQGHGRVSRLA